MRRRAIFRSDGGAIVVDVPGLPPDARDDHVVSYAELRELERANAERALRLCGGQIAGRGGAAELLGIRPTTLRSKLQALGVLPKPG